MTELRRYRLKPETYAKLLKKRVVRRTEFLADKVCENCGSGDDLRVRWKSDPGPIQVGHVWQASPANMAAWLPLLRVQCTRCLRREVMASARNEHGGGAQGIGGCKCGPCHERKAEYARRWKAAKRARVKAAWLAAQRKQNPSGTVGP